MPSFSVEKHQDTAPPAPPSTASSPHLSRFSTTRIESWGTPIYISVCARLNRNFPSIVPFKRNSNAEKLDFINSFFPFKAYLGVPCSISCGVIRPTSLQLWIVCTQSAPIRPLAAGRPRIRAGVGRGKGRCAGLGSPVPLL